MVNFGNTYQHVLNLFILQYFITSVFKYFGYCRPYCNLKLCVDTKGKWCCHQCALSQSILLKKFISLDGRGVEMELPLFLKKGETTAFQPKFLPFISRNDEARVKKGQYHFYTTSVPPNLLSSLMFSALGFWREKKMFSQIQ